jgi:hypothetical protein
MIDEVLYTVRTGASKEGVGTGDGGLGETTLQTLTADGSNNVGKMGLIS